jgi:hypothetical protein
VSVEIIRIRLVGGPRDGVEFEAAKGSKYVTSIDSNLEVVRYNASDEYDNNIRLFYYGGKVELSSEERERIEQVLNMSEK